MKKMKTKKIIAASLILVLVAAIFSIIKISSVDKFKGLVKVNKASLTSISTKLSANISDLSADNNIEVKGYDEVDYNISYTLSDYSGERDVIINAKIDENDPYASFKEVTGADITSVLSSNRKEITITISNLPSNQPINSKVTMLIVNAPKGYTVRPTIRIKESTASDYTNITVRDVTVNTSSVQGRVIDEEGNIVPNILISLKKNTEVIKETYTNSEGIYTLSDITPDTYSVVVNEENYEDLELNNLYIQDGNMLNLIVRRVYPYKIETNKYITKVELNNLGSSKDYLYNDVTLANIPVRKVDNLHGKIYYKITVQNTGEKKGIISSVKDELPEGLSFDESLNSGYELKNGIIYNRNLEGIELSAGEQISDTLVLTIENTDIARTYINKVNARGELYEHVVYLLNGRTYKTLDVLEGETIDEPTVNDANFSGWYTDEKLTNKYNFSLPVEKDLILYGVTTRKHTVKFIDKDPENPGDPNPPIYDEKEVPNGDPVDKPRPDPEHEGYDFCGWTKDDVVWDFNTPVTEDLTLVSKYCIKSYNVEFYDKSASNGITYNLIDTISKEYKSTLSNSEAPDLTNAWTGHNFLKWTTDPEGNSEYNFATLIKNDIKLYAQYSLQDRSFIFNDENRITEKTVEYGAYVQPIADQGKEGHDFLFWSLTNPSSSETKEPFDFANTQIFTTTTVYAIYQIKSYDVIYNDVDPWTSTSSEYARESVEHGSTATKPSVDPTKEGHTFDGWYKDGEPYVFSTPVTEPITLTSHYTKIKVNVRFMDGENLWENKQVDYADTVTAPLTSPTKEHHVFKFWSEDGINEFDYTTQIKQDKTLYSVYEEITPPTITHTPLYWTNDKVLVTITGDKPEYTYVYKVDDGTYQNYTEPFEMTSNGSIVAKSVYGEVESVITSHEVTNIDKLNPVIGTLTTTPSLYSITISGTMTDGQSGVKVLNVYNNNVLSGSAPGSEVNAELRAYTTSKDMAITVTGLLADTEYTFKVELIDGAGNVSEETVTARTVQPEIICQIISVNGNPLPEEDYIEFPLLSLAIADTHCDSKCTIQMLKNTNESVSILNTQDITLDLNGQTVAGVLPGYTVDNQGTFTLIDKANEAGGLINANGISVYNNANAKFIMGEGSAEQPNGTETRLVSTTVPYVFGETYGIYSENDSEFAFFDGKIKGENAVQGEVTETEYSYNATSSTADSYEVVTLSQLDDPEARINKSVYYSNVANAVGDAKIGTSSGSEITKTSFLSGFTHSDAPVTEDYISPTGYHFVYDPDTETLYSTNDSFGTIARSETVVDLTNYTEDQYLDLNYIITPNQNGSFGSGGITIYPLDSNYDYGRYDYISSITATYKETGECFERYKLTAGNKYKVIAQFTQGIRLSQAEFATSDPEKRYSSYYLSSGGLSSKLIITNASLSREVVSDGGAESINSSNELYGFYYDENTGTIRSNNQYKKDSYDSTAYSYIELDLTNKTGTYDISVNASIEGYYESKGIIAIEEFPINPVNYSDSRALWYARLNSGSSEEYSSSYPGAAEFFGHPYNFQKFGPYTASKKLEGGKKYYLSMMYQSKYYNATKYWDSSIGEYVYYSQEELEQYGISDQLIISSISLVKTGTSEVIDITSDMVGNAFDTSSTYTHWDNNEYYTRHETNFDDYYDSYVKIDLTNATNDKLLEVDDALGYYNFINMYITSNNMGLSKDYIRTHKEDMILYKHDNNVTYVSPYMSGKGVYGSYNNQNYLLEKGNVYYVHFNLQLGFYSRNNYAGNGYDCSSTSDYCGMLLNGIKLHDVEDIAYSFGTLPINIGTESYDGLSEDTNTITQGDSINPIINSGFMSYQYDSENDLYYVENVPYYGAALYTAEIDLTNETESKMYYYSGGYSGSYGTVSYITKDELKLPKYSNTGSWNYPSYEYGFYPGNYLSLEPGHKYYFVRGVYGSGYSSGLSPNRDWLSIKLINAVDSTKEYDTSNRVDAFNEDVDEIQILKDIQLKESIEISRGKEAVLDLNGHTITSSLDTPIIRNYGKLTVKDSDYEKQTSDDKTHYGILTSTAGTVVENKDQATLIMKDFKLNANCSWGYGINNNGTLVFDKDSDSIIYVNSLGATGLYNGDKGAIDSNYAGLQIVMNYNNQAEVSYMLYKNLDTSNINTGFKNEGFVNIGGLKISGKNGTGFKNELDGTAILRTANISVPLNALDMESYGWYDRWNNFNEIRDVSLYIENGRVTITDGSTIGYRLYNESPRGLFLSNMTSADYVLSRYSNYPTYVNNGATIRYAELHGDSNFVSGGQIRETLNNYGKAHINSVTWNDAVINNYENGEIDAINFTNKEINNYDNGVIVLKQGSTKHIINKGKSVTLERATVNNTDTTYENAIENSSILNIDDYTTVKDVNKYGIWMNPVYTQEEVEFRNRKGYWQSYYQKTYKQVELNIGGTLEDSGNYSYVNILGKERGVTGSCYLPAGRTHVSDTAVEKTLLKKTDGTVEPITQANYDQSLCTVNMYSGSISSTDSPNTPSAALALSIDNTADDSYTLWSRGLYVYPKSYALENNKTSNVVKIGDTDYISLKDAIDSITTNDPVTIDIGWYTDVGSVTIPEGRNITLNFTEDHNAFTYATNGSIINNGNLTVRGLGKLFSMNRYAFINNGNIVFDGGTYSNNWTWTIPERAVVKNNGTAVFNGGVFNQLDVYNTKDLTINSGDFIGTMVYGAGDESVTTVKGGYFNNLNAVSTYLTYLVSDSTSNTNGGWRHVFELNDGATAVVDGLNTDNDSRYDFFRPIAHLNNSTLEFKSGKIGAPSAYYPVPYIVAENNSNVIFDDGTYENIHVNIDSSTLTVNGGNLTSYKDSGGGHQLNLVYLHGKTPTANILGGNLYSDINAIGISDYSLNTDDPNEIYSFKVLLGTKGDLAQNNEVICSKTSPSLTGKNKAIAKYGIGSGAGFIGFYDGITKAPTTPTIDADINEIEDDFEIITDSESINGTSYVTQYLDQKDLVLNRTTGVTYKSLQKAFNEATNNDILVTLRDYTNTTNSSEIVIPTTSKFTLIVRHNIIINNTSFIKNYGNATIVGMNGTGTSCSGNDPADDCYTGLLSSNVTGSVFNNYGTLTINDLKLVNIKASDSTIGTIITNNENAILNINGANMSTVQHTFVANYGTLNVDKNVGGTSSCYNPTTFNVTNVAGSQANVCLSKSVPILNNGIADIKYLNVVSADYCRIIENNGDMSIESSTLDQSATNYEPLINDYADEESSIINNNELTIKDSNFIFIPRLRFKNEGNYHYIYYSKPYISCSNCKKVDIDNSIFETSFYGLLRTNIPYGVTEENVADVSVRNTTLHNKSFAIDHSNSINIELINNNFDIQGAIIDGSTSVGGNEYMQEGYIHYYVPTNTNINIEGGTYNTQGELTQYSLSYDPIDISYNTMCSNNNMTAKTISSTNRTSFVEYNTVSLDHFYMNGYTNAIDSNGNLTIKDATINYNGRLTNTPFSTSEIYIYDYNGNKTRGLSANHVAVITAFGNATIINSTINNLQGSNPAIRTYNNGTITLGTKDGNYDINSPQIVSAASQVALGKINFYDGIIKTTSASIGSPSFIDHETGYIISGDNQTKYLTQENVIRNITKNNTDYISIQDAIDEANSNDELQLLISVYPTASETYNISGKTLTIDLNNKQLTAPINVTNSANVTITDSASNTSSSARINVTDATANINNNAGIVNAYGTAVVNLTGNPAYTINANDDSVINLNDVHTSDNTRSNIYSVMNDDSTINLNSSKIQSVTMNSNSLITFTNSQNNDSYVDYIINKNSSALNISDGHIGTLDNGTKDGISVDLTLTNSSVTNITNYESATLSLNNVDTSQTLFVRSGTVSIDNSNISSINVMPYDDCSISINGGTYNSLSNGSISYNRYLDGISTVTIDGNPVFNNRVFNTTYGRMYIKSGTFNGGLKNYAAEFGDGKALIVIGEKDGNIDTTSPTISNINNQSEGALINEEDEDNDERQITNYGYRGVLFYDGVVIGTNGKSAIVGLIQEIENNYKFTVDYDTNTNTETAYLTLITNNDPRIAMVNGINYNSLQQAINKSVQNCTSGSACPNVTIFLDIDLDADLTIADGYSVNIISNGYTIRPYQYNVPSTITLDGQPITDPNAGGDIIHGLRGLLGIGETGTSVLVYEMADGSALSSENHYRLYEYTGSDYELVTMEKGDEVARYNPGRGVTNMKPIKGRLYITNLEPGDYKVVDDNNSEVTFTINSDGTLSGHVKEYTPSTNRIESTGEAKLLISIQTGIRRVNYMLIAISLIVVLSIMFILKKKKEVNS